MAKKYRIAVLPGDGIGREVIPQAVETLETAQEAVGGFELEFHAFDGGGEYYVKENREWSEEAEDFTKKEADAVLLGAVGAIASGGNSVRLPDGNLAGYSLVIGLRFELDLYANVRPVKLFEGVPTPLANKTHEHIDMLIVRENTEGLYTPIRGKLSRGEMTELAVDLRIITLKGAERASRYAFNASSERSRGAPVDGVKRVTCVDKSNLLASCKLFRDVFDEVGKEFPSIERDYAFVDAWTQWCLRKPEFYDVVVAPNEFGDIISDLGGAVQGGLGVAPAGSIGDNHAVFEPVHGSAPKHYGQRKANPIAAILASSMMLDWLGSKFNDKHCSDAGDILITGVANVLKEGKVRTYDLCRGDWESIKPSSTDQVGDAIRQAIKSLGSER